MQDPMMSGHCSKMIAINKAIRFMRLNLKDIVRNFEGKLKIVLLESIMLIEIYLVLKLSRFRSIC